MAIKINTSSKNKTAFTLFLALFLTVSNFVSASDGVEHEPADSVTTITEGHTEHADKKEGKVDIGKVAIEHVMDSHSWHLWGEHENAVSMSLPVILKTENGLACFSSGAFHHDVHGKKVVEVDGQRFVNFEETIYYASESANEHGQYLDIVHENGKEVVKNSSPLDFSITKNAAQLIFSAIILVLLFTSIARSYKKTGVTSAPKGKQSFFEPLIVFVRDDIAKTNIGGQKYEKYVPYLLTVFFLILINNVFGLIPISANVTGNIAFTFVLSIFTFIVTTVSGNSHYWKHIFLPKPFYLWFILMPIEFVGIFTKPFALMIRLFANMTAGHIIVISLVGLIFVFETLWISPISVAFALFIDVLECLVALLQAYIFTLLTALFIGSASADHNEDGVHNDEDEKALAGGH